MVPFGLPAKCRIPTKAIQTAHPLHTSPTTRPRPLRPLHIPDLRSRSRLTPHHRRDRRATTARLHLHQVSPTLLHRRLTRDNSRNSPIALVRHTRVNSLDNLTASNRKDTLDNNSTPDNSHSSSHIPDNNSTQDNSPDNSSTKDNSPLMYTIPRALYLVFTHHVIFDDHLVALMFAEKKYANGYRTRRLHTPRALPTLAASLRVALFPHPAQADRANMVPPVVPPAAQEAQLLQQLNSKLPRTARY